MFKTYRPLPRLGYTQTLDAETLEAAVVLVVFQRVSRQFVAGRYHGPLPPRPPRLKPWN